MTKVKITGLKKVLANLDLAKEEVNKIANKSMLKVSSKILENSRDLTPFDKGTLRSSGNFKKLKDMEYSVYYDTDYAARLHEHPEYRFTTPGTGAKYLERPFNAMIPKIAGVIKSDLRNKL